MELTPKLAAKPKPKHTMLPLLVVLFLISYVLLTTLVVLQDKTIDSQRSLIHLLFKDNLHLVATKVGLGKNPTPASRQNAAAASSNPSVNSPVKQTPSAQVPSNQVPSVTPSTQVPVIQAKPDTSAKAGQKRKAQKGWPSRPPAEVTDPSDMRRVTFSI